MAWFRLDDRFHAHPKVKRAGNPAIGLWVRCGTYSAAYDLDGFIDAATVTALGTRAEAAALVRARLWIPGERDGQEGVVIPDFLQYNLSAEETQERRARDAERKREQRARAGRNPLSGRFSPNGVTS